MPKYVWTCNKCGATIDGWDNYVPSPELYDVCKKKIATPEFDYYPVWDSMRCTFVDPILKEDRA